MENYSYTSYPESGDSSPRSRDIDFENPSPWEDNSNHQQQQQQSSNNYKVKFMCSYGGKIHPRPHDNQLSYIGGETKILAVDRSIKFSSLLSKLSSICDSGDAISFKYQLPGEDLDALISVTNDDDLEHMMHEYDRLYRVSPKPARLRLFLFPPTSSSSAGPTVMTQSRSFGSEEGRSEKERFVEALNSGPVQTSLPAPPQQPAVMAAPPPQGNADFLFGLDKGMVQAQPPPPVAKLRDPVAEPVVHEPEVQVSVPLQLPVHHMDDRLDPIQKHIQDLQRLRIEEQQGMHRRKSDDNLAAGFTGSGGEYYVQRVPETIPPTSMPVQASYGPSGGGVYPGSAEQPVYMIQAQGGLYHAPMGRPVTGPTGQPTAAGGGYYAVQRMPPPEVYRDQHHQQPQQMYNVMPSMATAAQPTLPPKMGAGYSDGMGMMRPATSSPTGGVGMGEATTYAQIAYDGATGRQVYYTGQSGMNVMAAGPPAPQHQHAAAQYQAMAAAVADGGNKVVAKATQA